jgi:hypothetical protein
VAALDAVGATCEGREQTRQLDLLASKSSCCLLLYLALSLYPLSSA